MAKNKHTCKKHPKINKCNYSPNKLKTALLNVSDGTMTAAKASHVFGIPRTTLIYKSTGRRPHLITKPGPKSMLGDINEKKIEEWVKQMSKKGFPITRDGLCFTAHKLLKEGHGQLPKTYNHEKGPSRRWYESFKARHPTLVERQAEYLHRGRASVKEATIRRWFDEVTIELGDQIEILKDPSRIFNTDESSFYLHPKSRPVIATKGQKAVYDASTQCNKENATVLITGNANGDIAPPMALFTFERIPSAIAATAHPRWGLGRTQKGWMTAESFFEYVSNVLNPYFNQNVKKPVVLFLDNHSSHLSLQLSEFCQQNGIILIALPANSTHVIQPLDVAFFHPLKASWSKKLEIYKLTHNQEPRKHHVIPILDSCLRNPDFKTNLKNGFRSCGLYPFDPDNLDYSKCIDIEERNSNENIVDDREVLLQSVSNRIPVSMKKEFDRTGLNKKWSGNVALSGLFHFYKSLKYDLDFDALMKKEKNQNDEGLILDEIPIIHDVSDISAGISYFELEDDVFSEIQLTSDNLVLDSIEQLQISPISIETANNQITATSPPSSPLASHLLNTSDEMSPVSNVPQSLSKSPCDIELSLLQPSPSVSPTVENLHSSSENLLQSSIASHFLNTSDEISPVSNLPQSLSKSPCDIELSLLQPSPSVSPTVENLHSSSENLLQPSIAPQSTSTPLTTKTSSSTKSSVEDILNGIVRSKAPETEKSSNKKARKRLRLPSVITCERWVELQGAIEKEKMDSEILKKKRIEERKRKANEKRCQQEESRKKKFEKNQLKVKSEKIENKKNNKKNKVSASPIRKKKIARRPKKKLIKKDVTGMHNGILEVAIDDWVIVQYNLSNTTTRSFIAQITDVEDGQFLGNFLRPAQTREFSGYVYCYPKEEDISEFDFSQIKTILPEPEEYNRGMKKFNVHCQKL